MVRKRFPRTVKTAVVSLNTVRWAVETAARSFGNTRTIVQCLRIFSIPVMSKRHSVKVLICSEVRAGVFVHVR